MGALVVVIIIIQSISYAVGKEWSYQNQNHWPDSCKGKLQSPIKIEHASATPADFNHFDFDDNTYRQENAFLTNTGRSLQIHFSDNENFPTLSGGGLEGTYILEALHFHWPAEHVVNDRRYALEGHFVYYAKRHKNLRNALKVKNGVAVVAVSYDVGQVDNPAFEFVEDIPLVANDVNEAVPIDYPILLRNFLPMNTDDFYRYEGSLTTPNCDEVVVWTIFSTPSYISLLQLEDLKSIWDENDMPLESNNRHIQRQNGRTIYIG